MSHEALRYNLKTLVERKKHSIASIERKAGVKRNNLYNIIKGTSKNPSATLIQALADTFGVSIEELFSKDGIKEYPGAEKLTLFADITNKMVEEIKSIDMQITISEVKALINDAYQYSVNSNLNSLDQGLIRWFIQLKIAKAKRINS